VDRERRPIGPSYVITQGTFLICSLGNYLIADRVRQQCDVPPELVARADWNIPLVDAVALASVISSATVGLAVAFYSAHRTAKTAWEGRVEQRSADGLWGPQLCTEPVTCCFTYVRSPA
jgi:hypothetical protein